MKQVPILFIILISSLIVSCEKDKQPLVENEDMELISKILLNGELHQEYIYNNQNLITEEKSKFFYTGHSYNDDNQLVRSEFYLDPGMFSSYWEIAQAAMNRTEWVNPSNSTKSLTQEFEYDKKNLLIKKTYVRPSSSYSEYMTFTYDNDRISRQTMYWQNNISGYIDFFYDSSGNLTKEEKYGIVEGGAPELWTTHEYEFDNMKNPYYAFRHLRTPGKYTNPNNIVKETYTIHFEVDAFIEKVQIIENSYEYNDKGYPVKVNKETEYVYK
jgi:hypothetical protein